MSSKQESYSNSENWTTAGTKKTHKYLDKYDSGFYPVNQEAKVSSLTELLWDEGGKWDSLTNLAKKAPAGADILLAGLDVVEMLLAKNISYGNSAIEPLRLFSKANNEEQIYVRVDDKLSRLKNNQSYPGDNDIDDLIGYLILLKVARRKNG